MSRRLRDDPLPDFKEGQYVYMVSHDLIGRGRHVERKVLLEWDVKNDHYKLGDSKDPRSFCSSGFPVRDGVYFYESPVEAVNAYVSRCIAAEEDKILLAEAEVKRAKAEIAALRKIDHTKLKVKYEEDTWVPCDY